MTPHANSLTERVTRPAGNPAPTWTAPASDLRVLLNALERLGYTIDTLLAAAGLRGTDFDDPDVRVPCEAYGPLLARAQQERFTPNLALEIARLTPMGAYPLLDYLVLTSDTVGAGVRHLAHYFRLVGIPIVITPREDADPIRVEIAAPAPFSAEYLAALMVLHFRSETDGRFAAATVSFQHTPDDVAGFERVLDCHVHPKASWTGVSMPLEAWRLPLRRRDPVLRQVLESQANEILARLPTRTGLALEVQRALTKRVGGGGTQIGALARELAMSGRTLQRRLAAEGVSYQDLLDEVSKETGGRCISESTMAIGEVINHLVQLVEPSHRRTGRRASDAAGRFFATR
jgi:AraC-like DNA-binding protein